MKRYITILLLLSLTGLLANGQIPKSPKGAVLSGDISGQYRDFRKDFEGRGRFNKGSNFRRFNFDKNNDDSKFRKFRSPHFRHQRYRDFGYPGYYNNFYSAPAYPPYGYPGYPFYGYPYGYPYYYDYDVPAWREYNFSHDFDRSGPSYVWPEYDFDDPWDWD